MTRIFEFPLSVSGSGPYISMAILSKGVPDLTMVIGFFLVLPPGPFALTHTPHWASQLLTSARMSCQKYLSCRRATVLFIPRCAVDLFPWACWRISFCLPVGTSTWVWTCTPSELSIDDAIFHHQALPLSPVIFCSQTELWHFIPPGFFSSFHQPSPDRHDVRVFSL